MTQKPIKLWIFILNRKAVKMDEQGDCRRCDGAKAHYKRFGYYALVFNCIYGEMFCIKEQHDAKQPHSQEKPYEYLILKEDAVAVLGTNADIPTIQSFPGSNFIESSKENPRQNIVVIKRYKHE